MPTVSTANVNGVRAAATKGLCEWISGSDADVICLQEVRALPEEIPAGLTELLAEHGWWTSLAPSGTAKGRSGVAVLTRAEPEAARIGFGDPEIDAQGRYLEVDLPGLTVASLYLTKGVAGTAKQEAKDRFLDSFGAYLRAAFDRAAADGREMVVCGDWNIAPAEADLRNWRTNRKNSGFLPHEREWWAGLLAHGWVDVVRELHPGVDGPYTWWTYRGRAFDNDVGWRIDHQLATPGLAARAKDAVVHRAPSHDRPDEERTQNEHRRWSDHAAVTVRYLPS